MFHVLPLLFLVTFLPPTWAAGDKAAAGATVDPATWQDIRASELIGKKVAGKDAQPLGEVKDLAIDVRSGHIPHVILSFGGLAELGDKLFVFPVNAFERDQIKDRLVLNVERSQLKQSSGFDRSNWPFDPPLRRASELRGANVTDPDGKAVGEIEDLVVNMDSGRIERVWLAQDGRRGAQDKQALPLSAFAIPDKTGGEIVLKK